MGTYAILIALSLNAASISGAVPQGLLKVKNVNNNEIVVFQIKF